jgi:hypothetical protein
MLQLICLIVAIVLFVISAFYTPPRFSLMALGLAFFAASFLASAIPG